VVVGASYSFLIPAVSIAFSSRMSVFADPHQVSPYLLCVDIVVV